MDDLELLLAEVGDRAVRLDGAAEWEDRRVDGALFDAVQLPLVAFAILAALSLHARVRLRLSEVGLRVGLILMDAFPQFGIVGRRLPWSLRVRATAADAISFLEGAGLVEVEERAGSRALRLAGRGREFVRQTRGEESDASEFFNLLRSSATRTQNEELSLL